MEKKEKDSPNLLKNPYEILADTHLRKLLDLKLGSELRESWAESLFFMAKEAIKSVDFFSKDEKDVREYVKIQSIFIPKFF